MASQPAGALVSQRGSSRGRQAARAAAAHAASRKAAAHAARVGCIGTFSSGALARARCDTAARGLSLAAVTTTTGALGVFFLIMLKCFASTSFVHSANPMDTWHLPFPLGGRQTLYFAEYPWLTLGKVFAESPTEETRQPWLCRKGVCRVSFAECNTRQRLCRV